MSTRCNAPWVSRFVYPDGRITACCYTPPVSIDSLKEQFNDGKKPAACGHCWAAEKKKLRSPRNEFNDIMGETVSQLTIGLGNYCNAECIICNGDASSGRNTWAQKYSPSKFKINVIASAHLDTINFLDYPELTSLTLIGGEPAIHPSTNKILDQLIELGLAKNLTISLNTNASRLDDALLSKLREFKSISVILSIDGTGDYFEYQRRPLKWKKIKEIAEQWMAISENIVINYVVTAISIWSFNDFIGWIDSLSDDVKRKQPILSFTHVWSMTAAYLTLHVLTDEQKKQWINNATDHPAKQDIINILTSTNYNPSLSTEFIKNMKLEDITSKLKFAEIFPDWPLNE
jgi:MoaA/NifB/PqqE/SkfB family radical SAM enzyme